MNVLLCTDAFDSFMLAEGSVTTFFTMKIDGHFHGDYFENDDLKEEEPHVSYTLAPWSMLRDRFYSVIKGSRAPLAFRIVLFLPEERMKEWLADEDLSSYADSLRSVCIRISFDKGILSVQSGTDNRSFTTDRSAEKAWDKKVAGILKSMDITVEDTF